MKLILYSGGCLESNLGINKSLSHLLEKKALSLTYIPSCSYQSNQDYFEVISQFEKLGVSKFIKFNIDQYYSKTLKKIAFKSDIIYLGGGNTFYFLSELRKNGLLKDLKKWAVSGTLMGLSAGAILMTPKITTASFPEFDRDDNDEKIKNLKALELVDFEFFPHYKNSSRYKDELIEYSKKSKYPIYACPDGSGIIQLDGEIRFIGRAVCFYQGQKYIIFKS